jgi:hypothetical protein
VTYARSYNVAKTSPMYQITSSIFRSVQLVALGQHITMVARGLYHTLLVRGKA